MHTLFLSDILVLHHNFYNKENNKLVINRKVQMILLATLWHGNISRSPIASKFNSNTVWYEAGHITECIIFLLSKYKLRQWISKLFSSFSFVVISNTSFLYPLPPPKSLLRATRLYWFCNYYDFSMSFNHQQILYHLLSSKWMSSSSAVRTAADNVEDVLWLGLIRFEILSQRLISLNLSY